MALGCCLYITYHLAVADGCVAGQYPIWAVPVFYRVFEEDGKENGDWKNRAGSGERRA